MLSPEEFFKNKYNLSNQSWNGILSLDTMSDMTEFAKLCVIEELEKHIEHPNKPGYKRHDIVSRIKELKK